MQYTLGMCVSLKFANAALFCDLLQSEKGALSGQCSVIVPACVGLGISKISRIAK
jgi:hypothetical protein